MHAAGLAAPQGRQELSGLVREDGDDDEVVRCLLVEVVGDRGLGALPGGQDDPVVAPQLGEAPGTGAGDDGHVVACPRELVGVGAADAPGTDDGDGERGRGCVHDGSSWTERDTALQSK